MSAHLIPNHEFLKFKGDIKPETKFIQIQEEQPKKFEELSKDLEIDLKNKMEYNWKLIYALDDIVH